MLLFIRNPDPIFSNILFTEDGLWTGMLLNKGFFASLWFARNDYFVFLNLAILNIAMWLNELLFGFDLSIYPSMIALISYIFFAGSAVTIWLSMKNYLGILPRLFLYLAVLLLLLGSSTNEVLGRASNIGFILPVLLVAIFIIRENSIGIKKLLVDILAILFAATNPICIGMWTFFLIYKNLIERKFKSVVSFSFSKIEKLELCTTLIFLSLTLVIASRYYLNGNPSDLGRDKLIIAHFIESIIARPILFPWISTFYHHMSDTLTFFGFALFLTIFFFGYYSYQKNETAERVIGLGIISTLLFISILIIILRPGLTNWIGNYKGIYPDRYFMGQNLLSIWLILWALNGIKRRWFNEFPLTVISLSSFILIPIIISFLGVFEFYKSRAQIPLSNSFKESIAFEYTKNPSASIFRIQTYPEGWFVDLPAPYARATALSDYDRKIK